MMTEVTIVLAEDHQVVRQGLRLLLETQPEFRVVGEASDGLEAVRTIEQKQPDVLVLDLMMPGLDGVAVTQQVSRRFPRTRVVILSMQENEAYVYAALAKGAVAYVLKQRTVVELVQAVHAVMAGRRYLSAPYTEEALSAYQRRIGAAPLDALETLTEREREVFQLAAEGYTSAQIGARLNLSRRTVETHRAQMMQKLGLQSQTELVRYAIRKGIVFLDGPVEGDPH